MSAVTYGALSTSSSNPPFLSTARNPRRPNPRASCPDVGPSFDELTAPHIPKIFRIIYRITKNREDAEDAMQDALLQALVHFEDFNGRSTFATWLTRIAINCSLMLLRKRRNAKTVSLNGERDFEASKVIAEVRDPAPDAEARYLQNEREATVRKAIKTLRPTLKNVVELAQLGERSIRETAAIMGLSPAAAKARLFHARKRLRNSQAIRGLRGSAAT